MSRPGVPRARRTKLSRYAVLAAALLSSAGAAPADDNTFVLVAGGEFRSTLPTTKGEGVRVGAFLLQQHPVTNAEFRAFLLAHREWRRDAVPRVLADADYLTHWAGPLDPGSTGAEAPVTRVSWFAADAYCEAQRARLPTWYEWELAAAASTSLRDARSDPAWRQQLLDWYARPVTMPLPAVEQRAPNVHGLYDLHGLVWEWVQDFNALLPADADPEQFCGSGAQNLQQKENYAVLMRIALLGSLRAGDTGHAVGFRCARDAGGAP